MLGTSERGGMYSVAQSIMHLPLAKHYGLVFISTHNSGSTIKKFSLFTKSLFYFLFQIMQTRIKIVHMHFSKKGSIIRKMVFIAISKIFGKKVILQAHGADFFTYYKKQGYFFKILIRKFLNSSDAFIVLSEERKEEYSKLVDLRKIWVIPNFVKTSRAIQKVEKSGTINLLSLGILGKRKGTYDLITAVYKLRKKDILLNLAGNGDVDKCRALVVDLHLNKTVKVLGWVSGKQKRELMESADIFVLPSYEEDLPMAILESMAYGLPIISTNVAGIPSLVKDGVNGYLIKPGDIRALSSSINKLLDDKTLRKRMGKESYKLVKNRFEQRIVEKQFIKLYNCLMEYSGKRSSS